MGDYLENIFSMSAFQACGETAESEERASVGRVRRAILRKANGECRRAE